MSKSLRTKIEWAHFTLNFWWGCTKVSEACRHCYAETMAKLFSKGKATWGPAGERWLNFDSAAAKLGKINREARREEFRPRVFVNSMSDTFEDNPLLDVTRCMMLVLLEANPDCEYLLLTKRPENVRRMVPPAWLTAWPEHVWIGTTVEDQAAADVRIPHLCQVPARRRFLSCEPLLGPINLGLLGTAPKSWDVGRLPIYALIDWVIAGGESGGHARPSHPDWIRALRDECEATNVLFFFKQWGEWAPARQLGDRIEIITAAPGCPKNPNWHTFPGGQLAARAGVKAAGRALDGREWNDAPVSTI
jgi:protein gp37